MNGSPTSNTPTVWAATRLLFSRKEASILLGLSPSSVTRAIDNGKLDIVRKGRRTMIARAELERYARVDDWSFRLPA
jgi:excisionase family DNA binding protein